MAEWLRRWTANPMGSARVGSNPILVENLLFEKTNHCELGQKGIKDELATYGHCWCSGIMQDSHSCDPGSIPGQCNNIL